MLAPMQSVTNRALRSLFAKWARPDVLFTEFMRVKPSRIGGPLNPKDLHEARGEEHGIPLVFQLIGGDPAAVVEAARAAQRAGAAHLNLNVGCPFGRMGAGSGGNLLRRTPVLEAMLSALRAEVTGSLSVKVRAGYDDPEQIFSLLPLFEAAGVDFLVLHPRTVAQAYEGEADHRITARVAGRTSLPVIANGDVRTAADGRRVLEETGAAGLMLGRGAIADPDLFARLRGEAPLTAEGDARASSLRRYFSEVLEQYERVFCGEAHVLANAKSIVGFVGGAEYPKTFKRLMRAKSLGLFREALEEWA